MTSLGGSRGTSGIPPTASDAQSQLPWTLHSTRWTSTTCKQPRERTCMAPSTWSCDASPRYAVFRPLSDSVAFTLCIQGLEFKLSSSSTSENPTLQTSCTQFYPMVRSVGPCRCAEVAYSDQDTPIVSVLSYCHPPPPGGVSAIVLMTSKTITLAQEGLSAAPCTCVIVYQDIHICMLVTSVWHKLAKVSFTQLRV